MEASQKLSQNVLLHCITQHCFPSQSIRTFQFKNKVLSPNVVVKLPTLRAVRTWYRCKILLIFISMFITNFSVTRDNTTPLLLQAKGLPSLSQRQPVNFPRSLTCHVCLGPLVQHGELIRVVLHPIPKCLQITASNTTHAQHI